MHDTHDTHDKHPHTHGHGHGHGHGHLDFDTPEMAAHAELEAEVLLDLVDAAIDAAIDATAPHVTAPATRVVDVGCGPGVAACRLAARFPSAAVLAVDGAAEMVARAAERAERLGVADRVTVQRVELPNGFGDLDADRGGVDLVWASMSLHHIGDEEGALRRISALLAPEGILALIEHAGAEEVDSGEPGDEALWAAVTAARTEWFAEMRAALPGAIESTDHADMARAAGFDVLTDTVLSQRVDAHPATDAARFLRAQLARTRSALGERLDDDARARLDVLTEELPPAASATFRRRLLVCRRG